jgi:C-terminal processing protease CtpA/Prc
MRLHIPSLFLIALCAAAPATQVTPLPPASAPAVPVADAVLDAALRTDTRYQELQRMVDRLDADIAQTRLAPAHPRAAKARAARDALRRKLDDRRAEVGAELAAGPGRFAGEGLGLVVTKAAPGMTAALDVPRGSGLVVDKVLPKSAAEAGGLMAGDLIYRLDGQLLVNNEQFEVVIESLERGREVEVQFIRDGSPLKRMVKVTAGR